MIDRAKTIAALIINVMHSPAAAMVPLDLRAALSELGPLLVDLARRVEELEKQPRKVEFIERGKHDG